MTTATPGIWTTIATERRRLADELETFTDAQWETPTTCAGWTVHDVAAHLVMPFEISTPRFVLGMIKRRGDFDRAIVDLTERVKNNSSRAEIIATLRSNAESQWTPPKAGPEAPLGEVVVHGQDIRRALNLPHNIPQETIDLTINGMQDPELRANYADRIG